MNRVKQQMIDDIVSKLSASGIQVELDKGSDITITAEFLNAGWSTGSKTIRYEALAFLDESKQTVFLWEKTIDSGRGLSFGSGKESFFQSGKTLFRKVKSVQYGPDGKALEYTLDLGFIPKNIKECAKHYGWKFKTVLSRDKAIYPAGYIPKQNSSLAAQVQPVQPSDPEIIQSTKSSDQQPARQFSDPQGTFYVSQAGVSQVNKKQMPRGKSLIFWIVWSFFLLIDLLMIADQFSWTRLIILMVIQFIIVFLRNRLFKRPLISVLQWSLVAVLFLLTIAFTGDTEKMAFTEYKDYKQEEKASAEVLQTFVKAAETGDLKSTVNLFEESRQKSYAELFAKDPDKLKLIAKALKDAEMVQLSNPNSEAEGYPRYAEFEVEYDRLTFHIRMVKLKGQWKIERL